MPRSKDKRQVKPSRKELDHLLDFFVIGHVPQFCSLETKFVCLIFCMNDCFTSDHQSLVQSIQGQKCHGCIKNDIVIDLCL